MSARRSIRSWSIRVAVVMLLGIGLFLVTLAFSDPNQKIPASVTFAGWTNLPSSTPRALIHIHNTSQAPLWRAGYCRLKAPTGSIAVQLNRGNTLLKPDEGELLEVPVPYELHRATLISFQFTSPGTIGQSIAEALDDLFRTVNITLASLARLHEGKNRWTIEVNLSPPPIAASR